MDYLIVVAHVGAVLGLISTGFNLYAMVIDRRRDRPRLVVSPRVRSILHAGDAMPGIREGPHIVVEGVNAGPAPITVTGCEAALSLEGRDGLHLLVLLEAAPQRPPYEVTHGRSITFLYQIREPITGALSEVRLYDTLGRVWRPSKRDLRTFQRELRRHGAAPAQ
jgi:hypothetical protein